MQSHTDNLRDIISGLDKFESECLQALEVEFSTAPKSKDGLPIDDLIAELLQKSREIVKTEFSMLRDDFNTLLDISRLNDALEGDVGLPAQRLFDFLTEHVSDKMQYLSGMRWFTQNIGKDKDQIKKEQSLHNAHFRKKLQLTKSYRRYLPTAIKKLDNKLARLDAGNPSSQAEN